VQLETGSFAGRGLDHAYALTAHAWQGDDTKDIIAGIGSREYLATQKALYVDISRAKTTATIITDNKSQLISTISKKTGESMEALTEITGQRIKDLTSRETPTKRLGDGLETIEANGAKDARGGAETRENDAQRSPEKEGQNDPSDQSEKATETEADKDRKLAEQMLAQEARGDGRDTTSNDRSEDKENDGDKYDSEAVRKDLEEQWEKFAEDRARGRDERSR